MENNINLEKSNSNSKLTNPQQNSQELTTNNKNQDIINENNFPVHQSAPTPFPLGTRVHHSVFGDGKVIEKSGSADELKLVILFDSGGWKKIYPKFTNLEIIK